MSRPELMPDSFNNDPKVAVSFEVFRESIGLKVADLSEKIYDIEEQGGCADLIQFCLDKQAEIADIQSFFSMDDFLDSNKKKRVVDALSVIVSSVEARLNGI